MGFREAYLSILASATHSQILEMFFISCLANAQSNMQQAARLIESVERRASQSSLDKVLRLHGRRNLSLFSREIMDLTPS
jgi:hypothetical protein